MLADELDHQSRLDHGGDHRPDRPVVLVDVVVLRPQLAIGVRPVCIGALDIAEVGELQLRLVAVGERPQKRMDLDDVEHTAGLDQRGSDLGPLLDVGEPRECTDSRVDDIERAAVHRGDRVEHVGVHELRAIGESDIGGECSGRLDRRPREVDADDACASARPRQRVGAEVALQVQQIETVRIDAEFVAFERPQTIRVRAERLEVVELGLGVALGALVPPGAVRFHPLLLLGHRRARTEYMRGTRGRPVGKR